MEEEEEGGPAAAWRCGPGRRGGGGGGGGEGGAPRAQQRRRPEQAETETEPRRRRGRGGARRAGGAWRRRLTAPALPGPAPAAGPLPLRRIPPGASASHPGCWGAPRPSRPRGSCWLREAERRGGTGRDGAGRGGRFVPGSPPLGSRWGPRCRPGAPRWALGLGGRARLCCKPSREACPAPRAAARRLGDFRPKKMGCERPEGAAKLWDPTCRVAWLGAAGRPPAAIPPKTHPGRPPSLQHGGTG